jgi:nitrite reductase/ring-hydroxylating ferredoxin subunit
MCSTADGWVCITKRDEISSDAPFSSDSGDNGIGLYEVDGQIYALEDTCPHGPSLLSRGYVRDGMVMCPLHSAIFDIRTGKVLRGPAERNLETFPVQVKENEVYVQIRTEQ